MAKDVKILLNGKTISADVNDKEKTAYAFRIESGCSLTISGDGVVDGGSGCSSNIAVWLRENSELNINGGTFKVGRDSEGSGNSVIYIHKDGAKVRISGGEFFGPRELVHHPGHYYLVNVNNNVTIADIKITGGIFHGWDPADGDDEIPQSVMPLLADGYESYVIDANAKDEEGYDCPIYGVRPK